MNPITGVRHGRGAWRVRKDGVTLPGRWRTLDDATGWAREVNLPDPFDTLFAYDDGPTVAEARARTMEDGRPMTCECGCGVLWHTAPISDPCCPTCTGYRWAGGR